MSKERSDRPDRSSHLRLVRDHVPPITAPRRASAPAAPSRPRIEIIPLPDPPAPRGTSPADTSPASASHDGPAARFDCPGCGTRGRIDLVDLTARRVHLSCDRCYRMWQERTRAGDPSWRSLE